MRRKETKIKQKKCKVCRDNFTPWSSTQQACSPKCAIKLSGLTREKKERREHAKSKESLKSRSQWLRESQQAFNKYIRARDKDLPCISCQRHHQGQYHAGHYFTVGGNPELRFEELNVHKQCAPCNNHLSGNIAMYRKGLIEKIGVDKVEWLEGPHEAKNYLIDEIKEMKKKYNKLARELEND